MKIYLAIAIFFIMNFFFIVSDNNLSISTSDNLVKIFTIYFDWFGDSFNKISGITGSVVKMDWVPKPDK
jgi:hypothetical protein